MFSNCNLHFPICPYRVSYNDTCVFAFPQIITTKLIKNVICGIGTNICPVLSTVDAAGKSHEVLRFSWEESFTVKSQKPSHLAGIILPQRKPIFCRNVNYLRLFYVFILL